MYRSSIHDLRSIKKTHNKTTADSAKHGNTIPGPVCVCVCVGGGLFIVSKAQAELSSTLVGLLTLACVSSAQLTLCSRWKTKQQPNGR